MGGSENFCVYNYVCIHININAHCIKLLTTWRYQLIKGNLTWIKRRAKFTVNIRMCSMRHTHRVLLLGKIDNSFCLKMNFYFLPGAKQTTRSTMKKTLALFVFNLSTKVSTGKKCESHDFAHPFHGQYCPTEGIIIPNLSWHQCKLFCLETPSCQSVNYNFNYSICTYLTAICSKAIDRLGMAFALFTGRQPDECIEWIPKGSRHPVGDRSVTEGGLRFVARMQKAGNDFVGHMNRDDGTCYARDDQMEIKSYHGLSCQYLRILDICTVYYENFELGAPLPPTAVIGGYTAEGLPVYIGLRNYGLVLPGYHISGSNRVVVSNEYVTDNVKILVAL